jgi:hypothetical protein
VRELVARLPAPPADPNEWLTKSQPARRHRGNRKSIRNRGTRHRDKSGRRRWISTEGAPPVTSRIAGLGVFNGTRSRTLRRRDLAPPRSNPLPPKTVPFLFIARWASSSTFFLQPRIVVPLVPVPIWFIAQAFYRRIAAHGVGGGATAQATPACYPLERSSMLRSCSRRLSCGRAATGRGTARLDFVPAYESSSSA